MWVGTNLPPPKQRLVPSSFAPNDTGIFPSGSPRQRTRSSLSPKATATAYSPKPRRKSLPPPKTQPVIDLTISSDDRPAPPLPLPLVLLDSSPIKAKSSDYCKKRKTVVFSDILVSDMPSSPQSTPRKSILKPVQFPSDCPVWDESCPPSNPAFWLPGTVVQIPPNSPQLPQLILGCLSVLQDAEFPHKFEAYATLNAIAKLNNLDVLMKLPMETADAPHNFLDDVAQIVKRDITALESSIFEASTDQSTLSPAKNNPFSIRIIGQALKFMFFALSSVELNNFFSVEDIKWFYMHSCEVIMKPGISRTLLVPYLSIIKDCKFSGNKKKLIFELNGGSIIPESILNTLLNMKNFPSSSLIVEKFITLRNLVVNFPVMMAAKFDHWFPAFIINLCDFSFPLYSKIITQGVSALLEAAKNFLDNKNVHFSVRRFLESNLPTEARSFSSSFKVHFEEGTSAINHLTESLHTLIENGQYKPAMDIWVGITLLCGDIEDGIENWPLLPSWLQLHKACFNKQDSAAKVQAISSWKAMIFVICNKDLSDLKKFMDNNSNSNPGTPKLKGSPAKGMQNIHNVLRPKVKLLIHILVNVTSIDSDVEVIHALNSSFLSIIYSLLNPATTKNIPKYTQIYWDKIIQPVLVNFYFKKDVANDYMNLLGLRLLSRLLGQSYPLTEKNFNDIRCLSNEPVALEEINSLNPKWIYTRFERIMQNMGLVFQHPHFSLDMKFQILTQFLSNIKVVVKKEVKASGETFDIIDNLPSVLQLMFKHHLFAYANCFKLITLLSETFGGANLIVNGGYSPTYSSNVFIFLLEHMIPQINTQQTQELLSTMFTSVDKRWSTLLVQLLQFNLKTKNNDLDKYLVECIQTKRFNINSESDLAAAAYIFQVLDHDYHVIAKRLIQDVVLVKPEDFEKKIATLKVCNWSPPIFKFFITLIHDAPYSHLKQMALTLLTQRWENNHEFIDSLEYLVDNRFDLELFNLRKNLTKKVKVLSKEQKELFQQIWGKYLCKIEEGGNFALFDELLVASNDANFSIEHFVNKNREKLPMASKTCQKATEDVVKVEESSILDSVESIESTQKDEPVESLKVDDTLMSEESEIPDLLSEPSQLEPSQSEPRPAPQSEAEPEPQVEAIVHESTESPEKEARPTDDGTRKTRSARKKTLARTRKASKKDETSQPNNFDISLFTSMLNSMLNSPTQGNSPTKSTAPSKGNSPTSERAKRRTRKRALSRKQSRELSIEPEGEKRSLEDGDFSEPKRQKSTATTEVDRQNEVEVPDSNKALVECAEPEVILMEDVTSLGDGIKTAEAAEPVEPIEYTKSIVDSFDAATLQLDKCPDLNAFPMESLADRLEKVSDSDIEKMTAADKHRLETELIKLMLRMRTASEAE